MGYVWTQGATFAASNILVLPKQIGSLRVALEAPYEWTVVSTFPEMAQGPTQEELLKWAFAGGVASGQREILPGVTLTDFGVGGSATNASEAVVERIGQYLGPPVSPIQLVLLPRAADLLRIDSPPSSQLVAIDLDSPDAGSLREMIRLLVPLWCGSSSWKQEKTAHGAPLLSGLTEYLAQTVPVDLGLANTSASRSIEYTWMMGRDVANVDLSPHPGSGNRLRLARFLKAPAVALAALQSEAGISHKANRIAEWQNSEFRKPKANQGPQDEVFSYLEKAGVSLPFEGRWSLDLTSLEAESSELAARTISIAFTAHGAGYLEDCGCKVSQDGGVSRRATALKSIRSKYPDTILLDIGNFMAVERNKPEVGPRVTRECDVYLSAMELMRYDLVGIGTFEVLMGAEWLSDRVEGRDFKVIGSVRDGGSALFSPLVFLERKGIRIAVLALWEKLDNGWLYESQERNTFGLSFPYGIDAVMEAIQLGRDKADQVWVIGCLAPMTLQEIAECGKVDLVINALQLPGLYGGQHAAKLDGTIVVKDSASSYGINHFVLHVGEDGKAVGGAPRTIRLDESIERDAGVEMLLASLRSDVDEAMSVTPLFGWDDWSVGRYVGFEACVDCHQAEFKQWRTTSHRFAMNTLRKAHRDRDPACVRCHALGVGRDDGYRIGSGDASLEGVQCDACHGSGARHVALPSRDNIRRLPPVQACIECHDPKHSDLTKSTFPQMLKKVSHGSGRER